MSEERLRIASVCPDCGFSLWIELEGPANRERMRSVLRRKPAAPLPPHLCPRRGPVGGWKPDPLTAALAYALERRLPGSMSSHAAYVYAETLVKLMGESGYMPEATPAPALPPADRKLLT